jgi:hypothetical protein
MKRYVFSMLAFVGCLTAYGQEIETEVPGDNFSLEGALELFKKSDSPEAFERLLNSPDSKVNNLDLNGDGYIDYIRVFDKYEGSVHAFIIQAVVSENENQDIAVIELEKLSNGRAVLQIIGDANVYGIETIIEPTREVRTLAGSSTRQTVVNVWTWPSVQYVYSPYYSGWDSPWGYHHHPGWYSSWRPVSYVHYHSVWLPYRPRYTPCYTRRIVYAHDLYRPYRSTSVIVYNRHHEQVLRYRTARGNGNSRSYDHRGGSAGDNRRSEADFNRGPSRRNEASFSRSDASKSRSMRSDTHHNATEGKRNTYRSTGSAHVESRRQPSSPASNRSRPAERSGVQSRPSLSPSAESIHNERNRREVKRDESFQRSSRSPYVQQERKPQVNTPVINRGSSTRNARVDRPSGTRQANAPAPGTLNRGNENSYNNRRTGSVAPQEMSRQRQSPVHRSSSAGSAGKHQADESKPASNRRGRN